MRPVLKRSRPGMSSPWIPADPDGLPPRTYPQWRRQEAERRLVVNPQDERMKKVLRDEFGRRDETAA